MTAIFTVITFFFLFVLVYLAISVGLALVAWRMARLAAQTDDRDRILALENKIDRLKEKAFRISIVVTFFFVAPFVAIYIFIYS